MQLLLVSYLCIVILLGGCTGSIAAYTGAFIVAQGLSQAAYSNRHARQVKDMKPVFSIDFKCNSPNQETLQNAHVRQVKGPKPYVYEEIQSYCSKKRKTVEIIKETMLE